jgi:hypothetical protein
MAVVFGKVTAKYVRNCPAWVHKSGDFISFDEIPFFLYPSVYLASSGIREKKEFTRGVRTWLFS